MSSKGWKRRAPSSATTSTIASRLPECRLTGRSPPSEVRRRAFSRWVSKLTQSVPTSLWSARPPTSTWEPRGVRPTPGSGSAAAGPGASSSAPVSRPRFLTGCARLPRARPSTSSAPICAICFLRRLQATSACLGLTPAFARASRRLRSTRRASCLRRRLYSRSAPMSVVRMRLQRLHDSSASTGSRLSQSATARQAARRSSSSRRSSVFIRGLTSRTWS